MTNFEIYADNPWDMEQLLNAATNAGLRARGCSMKLDFPPDGDWAGWLESEESDLPQPPPLQSETAEQYNVRVITDKLAEIKDALAHIQTPFAQSVRDILDAAAERVRELETASGGQSQ